MMRQGRHRSAKRRGIAGAHVAHQAQDRGPLTALILTS